MHIEFSNMEIDIGEFAGAIWTWLTPVLIVALVGLTLIGRAITPEPPQILSWTKWQTLKAERRYQNELGKLRQDVDTLAELLNQRPDPVQTQILAQRMLNDIEEGHPALSFQRELVAQAATDVQDWSVGALDRQEAAESLEIAVASLFSTGEDDE